MANSSTSSNEDPTFSDETSTVHKEKIGCKNEELNEESTSNVCLYISFMGANDLL